MDRVEVIGHIMQVHLAEVPRAGLEMVYDRLDDELVQDFAYLVPNVVRAVDRNRFFNWYRHGELSFLPDDVLNAPDNIKTAQRGVFKFRAQVDPLAHYAI